MKKPVSLMKRRRISLMLHAYLTFHARKQPQGPREMLVWFILLEWASLGGRKDEVIA